MKGCVYVDGEEGGDVGSMWKDRHVMDLSVCV